MKGHYKLDVCGHTRDGESSGLLVLTFQDQRDKRRVQVASVPSLAYRKSLGIRRAGD